jgi:hypothetical protein
MDPTLKKQQANRSKVWDHFLTNHNPITNKKQLVCTHCPDQVWSSTSGPSTLAYHLLHTHSINITTEPEELPFNMEHAHHLLVHAITKNGLALQLVSEPSFREFLCYLQPSYQLPSRQALSSNYLSKEYEKLQAVVKAKLATIPTLFINGDTWTSISSKGFIGILAHGVSWEWKYETLFLSFVRVQQSETAQFLARVFTEQFSRWGINPAQVGLISTDGAANFRAAVTKELKMPWAHCFTHILHLVVRETVEAHPVAPLINKARALAKHFKVLSPLYAHTSTRPHAHTPTRTHAHTPTPTHATCPRPHVHMPTRPRPHAHAHTPTYQRAYMTLMLTYHSPLQASPLARMQLEELMVRIPDMKPLCVKLDCPTRWSSTCDMLERLLYSRPAIAAYSATRPGLNLTDAEWFLIARLKDCLEPFMEATTELSSATFPTASVVFPLLWPLLHPVSHESDPTQVWTFICSVRVRACM